MEIPEKIIKAAGGLTDIFGGTLAKVGVHRGKAIYAFIYKEPVTIGMPELYLWDGSSVETMYGEEALALLATFSPA